MTQTSGTEPQSVKQVPVHLAEQLSAAQTRVYERHADLARAHVSLSEAEASFNEALADLNKVIHSVLALPQGVGESESRS